MLRYVSNHTNQGAENPVLSRWPRVVPFKIRMKSVYSCISAIALWIDVRENPVSFARAL